MGLREQLDASRRFDAEYGPSLSNHLPMALSALRRLGADDERLGAFAARYAARLHLAPPAERWPAGEPWRDRLGDPRAWPAYRGLFDEWLDHEGASDVLLQVLPALMQGVGAAAFHGLIRTAYATAAGHSHELADALAYWACRWFALGEPAPDGDEADPAAVLARLRLELPPHALIAEGMLLASQAPDFAPCVAALRIDREQTLPVLAALAARLYAASGNFTVLHLATSAHAMRVLLPWLDPADRLPALRHYWLAYAAGHAASGLTEPAARGQGAGGPDWPEIVARAVASDDDHAIKLVDTCREQEQAYGGAVWRQAAARAVPDA
jgi:hypothetical protein